MTQQIKLYPMMRGSGSIFCRLLASFLLLFGTAAPAQERVDSSRTVPEVRALEFGKPIARELAGGEVHAYQINLAVGQYLHVVVDQRGIDVVVRLLGPDGKQFIQVDNSTGTKGLEPVSVVSETAGMYRLEVRPLEQKTPAGGYEIKIEEWRAAIAKNRKRLAAEKAFIEGEQLRRQGTAESQRLAIKKYEEALPLWQTIGDTSAEAQTLHNVANAYLSMRENQKARTYLNQALPLWRAVKNRFKEGTTLNDLGGAHLQLAERHKALDYFKQALPHLHDTGNRRDEAATLNNIGLIYYYWGEPQQALDFFNQSLLLRRAVNDRRGEGITLLNMGLVYALVGERQKALEHYSQTLPTWRSLGDRRGESTALHNIGKLYEDLGEDPKALDYYAQALQLRRALGDRNGEANTLQNMGVIYTRLGEQHKALSYFDQALVLCRAVENRYGEAHTYTSLGYVYQTLGENQKALDYYNQALPLHRTVGNRYGEARLLAHIGYVHVALGEKLKALDSFNRALALSRAVGDKSGAANTLYHLAKFEHARDSLIVARHDIEMALAIIDSLRTKVASQQLRSSYFATVKEYYEFYIDVLMLLHQLHPAEKLEALALQANERARARNLIENLAEARANIRQGVDAAVVGREQFLQRQLNLKEQYRIQLLGGPHSEEQLAAVEKEIRDILAQFQEVDTQIHTANPRYAALTQPQPLTAKEIQQQVLDDETVLLEYALGEERSFLWAVTPTSLNSFALPKRAEIDSLARRVYELLTARNQRVANETPKQKRERVAKADADYQKAAAALSHTLLAPIVDQLGMKRLLVVTDGALQYIPFGALPVPLTTGYKPLSIDHEIVSLPSASVLAVLRRELAGRQSAPKNVAVLADPVFTSEDSRVTRSRMIAEEKIDAPIAGLESSRMREGELERTARDFAWRDTTGLRIPRLPFSRQEAEGIVLKLPANESLKALDFTASRATAMSAALSQYRIVHFATHGLLNSEHPELSGIVLSLVNENGEAQDGFLRLHEIYNLNLPADLVVLSACQTALGKEIKGEGLIGLTRGFMYAGAARVVASLWKVDDEATAELMKRFYQNMLGPEKLRPAAALRAAQVSMWKEKRWQAPYFWAAFVLQGEWK